MRDDVSDRVTLRAGSAALDLRLDLGGAVESLTLAGRPVLGRVVPASPRHRAAGIPLGAYPLLPLSNRVAGAAFAWGGTTHRLAPTFADGRTAIHGNAWQRAWNVADTAGATARLVLDHAGDAAWPFPYRAEQRLALAPGTLTLTLALTNTYDRPAPAGLGWHPFFPREGATLRIAPSHAWRPDERGLPAKRIAVPPGWDCSHPRPLATLDPVDTCFEGWDGTAEIARPGLTLRLRADPVFSHLVLMARSDRTAFAVEPVTHLTDAVNRADPSGHGLVSLPPGETLSGTIRLDMESA